MKKNRVAMETIQAANDVLAIARCITALEYANKRIYVSPEQMLRTVAAYYGYRIVKFEAQS